MTDRELSKYFDLEEIKDIISSPARPLVEAVAEDIIDENRKLSEDRIRLEKMVNEKRRVRDELKKLVPGEVPTMEDITRELVRERFSPLNGQLYVIIASPTDSPKCEYCDDERMITLTSPDGQSIRVLCQCSYSHTYEYSVVKAEIMNIRWKEITILPEGREDTSDNKRCVPLSYIDRDDPFPEMGNFVDCAWTSREKAEEALKMLKEKKKEAGK